jgi:hypothetical protein
MTKELVTYKDFCERALKLRPALESNKEALAMAWEDCAWCATLTDERILRALSTALARTRRPGQ